MRWTVNIVKNGTKANSPIKYRLPFPKNDFMTILPFFAELKKRSCDSCSIDHIGVDGFL